MCAHSPPLLAEEAIIYGIFVSEGEDWIQEYKAKKKNILKPEDDEDALA
jgi:hypothetical protein